MPFTNLNVSEMERDTDIGTYIRPTQERHRVMVTMEYYAMYRVLLFPNDLLAFLI